MGYRSYSYEEYLKAMEMIKRLGVSETSRKLKIPECTLYGWKNGEYIPPAAKWIPEPSKELAYVLGVLHGDGSICVNNHRYKIRLKVKDLQFADIFSIAMAKTLNKKYSTPRWYEPKNIWRVVYHSKAFYMWFKEQTLETLKPFIEHNKETVVNFLRGLYDSEGNHYKCKKKYSQIRLYNNDTELLEYVQHLLRKYFGIVAKGPYLNGKAGTKSKMENRIIRKNHNNYQIVIYRKQHTEKFLNEIGFSILEKQFGSPRRR